MSARGRRHERRSVLLVRQERRDKHSSRQAVKSVPVTRRRYYRVNARNLPLQASATLPGGEVIPCRLDDISLEGARIRLPTGDALKVGSELSLKVVRPGQFSVRLRAAIVHADEGTFGVRFLETAETLQQLFGPLSALRLLLSARKPQRDEHVVHDGHVREQLRTVEHETYSSRPDPRLLPSRHSSDRLVTYVDRTTGRLGQASY